MSRLCGRSGIHLPLVVWLGAALAPAGCGSSGPQTVPVEGRVTVNRQPLKVGSVSFRPDAARGNRSKLEPAGEIEADGHYRLYTQGKPGAVPGWYKVAVVSQDPPRRDNPYAPRPSYVDPKYANTETSGLEIEVVENPAPGAYDLSLKK